jgi:hypothetical protein
MAVVAVISIPGLRAEQYDAILARMDVVARPSPEIYIHFCAQEEDGLRIIELWDTEDGFRRFVAERMIPAATELGIEAEPTITIEPLHFLFAPRLDAIPRLPLA